MERIHWRETLSEQTADEAWEQFRGTLNDLVERNVPKCGIRTQLKNPWMTREILRLVRRKRRKWRHIKISATATEIEEYKRLEKETSRKIRNAKRKLEKDLAGGEDKNNRKFARYIKSKTKSKTTVGPLINKDGELVTEDKEIADELNRFFASVFSKEDMSNIPEPDVEMVGKRMNPICITQNQIKNKIQKLRKDAAPGPDGISPRLLQQLGDSILEPLEIIFNKSIESGCVPQGWKEANVTPIFK